jgi:hypothetical protein
LNYSKITDYLALPKISSKENNMKSIRKVKKAFLGGSLALLLVFMIVSSQALAQSWVQLTPTGGPPLVRTFHSAVHNPDSNRMVMFGGQNGAGLAGVATKLNDVWVLENADGLGGTPNWIQLNPSGTPPSGRGEHSAVYDTNNNRMIVFAGNPNISYCYQTVNDVWVLENADGLGGTPNWAQLSPTGTLPTKRGNHSAGYDPATNRMISFGGNDACGTFDNQVWILTNANGLGGTPNWTQLSPTGTPPPVGIFRFAVYDPTSNRMTVLDASRTPRVWLLENANGIGTPNWAELSPADVPPTIAGSRIVYDSVTNRMIVTAGTDDGTDNPGTPGLADNEVWALVNANGLGETPNWLQLNPIPAGPNRGVPSLVLNSGTNRMTMFGGNDNDTGLAYNDIWVLTDVNPIPECAPSPSNLVAWWDADEIGTGSFGNLTSVDVSGNCNYGEIGDANANPNPISLPGIVSGKVGNAFDFDQNYSHVSSSGFNPGGIVGMNANSGSIEMWTKPRWTGNDGVRHGLFQTTNNDASPDQFSAIKESDDILYFVLKKNGAETKFGVNANSIFIDDQWVHLAFTWDSSLAAIYADGVLVASLPNPTLPAAYSSSSPRRTTVGRYALSSTKFDGLFDEIGFYSSSLSTQEIQAIYNAGSAGKCKGEEAGCVEPPSNLVGWWPGAVDDLGVNAHDIQAGNDGTLNGSTVSLSGKVGDAFSLFGKNDYVEVPSNSSLQFDPSTPFSIEGWINVESYPATNTIPIVAKWGSQIPEFGYGLLVDANKKLQFSLDQFGCCRNNVTGASVINENTWYHFAATYDATTMRIYVNGTLEGSAARTVNGTNTSGSSLFIGNQIFITAGNVFTILIDELGIYNTDLSPCEIRDIYRAGSVGKCKSEFCSNGSDDDGDGLADCADPDCAALDNDSDGVIDPPCGSDCDHTDPNIGSPGTYYKDADNDTFGNPNDVTQACTAPAGYIHNNTDCDDNDSNSFPGNPEVCDGVDNDCDGTIDEGLQTTYYQDLDSDTYGNPAVSLLACSQPTGYVTNSDDCDDTMPSINPGAQDIPYDTIDQDCSGADLTDVDGDGFISTVAGGTDCDDTNPAINPAASEVCDGVDNNCDGTTDEGLQTTYYQDFDNDGYGDPSESQLACTQPAGYVTDNEDNCPVVANSDQADLDGDGTGDACDDDIDGDGVLNGADAFPLDASENTDTDSDGIGDTGDNCPNNANSDQADADGDGIGDVCDACPQDADNDIDGDGVCGNEDNCPAVANSDQADLDGDGTGDACDPDIDGDGVLNASDNCPLEDASGFDTNGDGCIDSVDDMPALIESVTLPQGVENSLLSTVSNAQKSLDKGNTKAATKQMRAFINSVKAQRGKKISDEDAQTLIDFAEKVINQI